jgi:FG-GAP repeat
MRVLRRRAAVTAALRALLALTVAAGMATVTLGAAAGAASAATAPAPPPRPAAQPGPHSQLTLAQAPVGLRAVIRKELGVAVRTGGTPWTRRAEFPRAASTTREFGDSVAISGSTAVVGAPHTNKNAGAAYVFTRSGTTWTEQARLTPSRVARGDNFGWSVAISGSTAVVGAPAGDRDPRHVVRGVAYVFTRSATTWSQRARLAPSNGTRGDQFGNSVAVAGTTAVVSSPYLPAVTGTGAAYVFVPSGTTWSQQAELTASDGAAGDQFGNAVAISGSTAVIGAPYNNGATGAAYVFTRSGTTWTQQAKLTASDHADSDLFGIAVAISGSTAVVGAPFRHAQTGAAYVFTRSGTTWTQQAKLTASDGAGSDFFGDAVAVSGSTAVVCAPLKDSSSGAAYVFTRSGTTWTQQAELTRHSTAALGTAVALTGSTAVVGAPLVNLDTGAAYVYIRSGTAWSQQARLT